ncbi:F-box/FBD/LRR-repeat protein [Sesamum alatum]|uniref:F-box/FBD/LRR-repeat protein n=1 Tax=Sesamum alatum TaxID=300844 RepID=A0AAE1YR99_9LAMI|nr:F-box/FBD/LRR-repeat protein [Sesamum alatum]
MDRGRKRSCAATADRISNLPCNVVDHILTNLPLRDAVRTSVLSSEWRYKWVTVPYLSFDWTSKANLSGKHNIESVIYQVLILHRGPIIKFKLNVVDLEPSPAIGHWLRFLSNHRLEELILQFSSYLSHKPVPNDLYTLDHLRHLYLVRAQLKSPLAFKGFSRLVRLDLENVYTPYGEFKQFISKCPLLEYLNVYSNSLVPDLEIDAPKLKLFHFSGLFISICFKNTPVLDEISITLNDTTKQAAAQDSGYKLIKFFGPVSSSVKRLKVNGNFLQFLGGAGRVPQKLPQSLRHLTVLQLSDINFILTVEVACSLCLIRSSQNLQILEVTSRTTRNNDEEAAAQFLKAQQNCELTFSRLENVKINDLSGSEPEMEFLKLLLSAATALMKLEVMSKYACAIEEESKILKELVRFRRASIKAEIIFQDRAHNI